MISAKFVITNFREKLVKLFYMVLSKIKMMKDVCKKPRNESIY